MTVPLLQPHVSANVKGKLKQIQSTQKKHYDKTAKNLPPLQPDNVVQYQDKQSWEPAMVLNHYPAPQLYNIRTANGILLRHNRRHLKKTNERPPNVTTNLDDLFTTEDSAPAVSYQMLPVEPSMARAPPSNEVRTRNGRIVQPPARFRDDK